MRLESALFSSKEGLNVNGQAIAVTGDNISNSNTTGYKTSRVEFADLLSEGSDGRQSTTIEPGGNGATVQRVRQIHEPGSLDFTGRELDVGIGGSGFFMVGDPANPMYTRAGNFSVDNEGLLVNAEGLPVLGFTAGGTTLGVIDMDNVNLNGVPTTEGALFGNLDASAAVTTVPAAAPTSFLQLGQSASFISNLTVYDSLGASHEISFAHYKTAANTWTVQAYIDGSEVTGGTEGVPVQVGNNLTLNFNNAGTIDEANQAAAVLTGAPNYANGAAAGNFGVAFGSYTQYSAPSQVIGISQNGKGTGNITSYEFQQNGEIRAVLDSGIRSTIGTIRLARFRNNDGLDRAAGSMFRATSDAGARTDSNPSEGGAGVLQERSLERSTVDISDQFTQLILYQRGYQAASQTLGVANNMLRDTLSLIR